MSVDLIGQEFGKLRVVSRHPKNYDGGRVLWNCLCLICKNTYTMRTRQVTINSFGCGRCSKIERSKPDRAKHIGKTYGNIKIVSFSEKSSLSFEVECLGCSKQYSVRHDRAIKNIHGCRGCHHKPGAGSYFWKGGDHIPGRLFSRFKYGAKKREIEWNITIKDLDAIWKKQDGLCAYSGRNLDLSIDNCTASLDRIDSTSGYVVGNIQFVHKMINTMKWDFKEEDFLMAIKEIYEHRIKV